MKMDEKMFNRILTIMSILLFLMAGLLWFTKENNSRVCQAYCNVSLDTDMYGTTFFGACKCYVLENVTTDLPELDLPEGFGIK